MRKTLFVASAAVVIASFLAANSKADVILSQTVGTSTVGGSGYQGQSFSTPTGGPWDNLTFSWIQSDGVTPLATGNLFILTQEYLGSPSGLSALTPGFVAESLGVAADAYFFNSSVTLDPSTQYWVYMGDDASQPLGGFTSDENTLPEPAYEQFGSPLSNYFQNSAEFNFILSGNIAAVPEPASMALWGLITAGCGLVAYRRRKLASKRRLLHD